ncbi:MAG: hypothetical protein AB7G48_17245 [Nitrospiraceae bacterium]
MDIQAWVTQGTAELGSLDPSITILAPLGDRSYLVSLPRYEPFKKAVQTLIRNGSRVVEVAGNEQILMTIVAPHTWQDQYHRGEKVCEWTLLTDPARKRVALLVPVGRLHETLPSLDRKGLPLDHLYDF